MGGASRQEKSVEVTASIGRLKRTVPFAVAGQTIDGSVEDFVAVVDVERSQSTFENDSFLNVWHSGGALQFVEDHLPVFGEDFVASCARGAGKVCARGHRARRRLPGLLPIRYG